MSVLRPFCLAAAALAFSSQLAFAAPIISGDGETWTSSLDAVCAQLSTGAPCGGTTVVVSAHSSWQDATLTNPLAQWVSYADTGVGGSTLAPPNGSAANPTGIAAIMTITETFVGAAGQALRVRFWADDTLEVYFNGVLKKSPVFGQATCADQPIGCEPNEFWDLDEVTTGNVDTITMIAYQVGSGTDTNSNPFGVLYSGTYTPGITRQAIPEPLTLSLLGAGLVGIGDRRMRRQ